MGVCWLVLLLALTSCSWHRLTPAAVEPPTRLFTTLGLEPEDPETSLTDLKNIGLSLERWRTADRVQFPWRAGDDVELVAHVRLRQGVERPEGRNLLAALAVGLTFSGLSCCVGAELTEFHLIDVRFVDRDGATVGTHSGRVATAIEFGMGEDHVFAARALDQVQIDQLAKQLAEWLQEDRAQLKRAAPPLPIHRSSPGP